ncbi:MAG: CDP-alcohol phosphatidyltransferase family protein [Actinomycetota bacterium]|nr:CDP-alcohol phosphatidyltransferase family protein [Actinomycetota bacterium]
MFDGRWLASVDKARQPVGSVIRRTGISADHLTFLGLVLAGATAVALATGRLGLGLVLLVATAFADLLDGPVAKAAGTAGPRGAFFDSVADRVADSLILGGLAWYLASEGGAHAALLPLAVLATSNLISYERAKAESLGYSAKGGLMERAERIIVLCVALAWSALIVPVLWVMLALTLVTAVQRFVTVWRQAPASARRSPSRSGSARPDAKWRSWRESARESAAARGGRTRRGGARTGGWRPAQERSRRRRAGARP